MAFDKLLTQFVVIVAAVVVGLLLYDRLRSDRTTSAATPVLAAELNTEKALIDRSGLRAEVVSASSQIKVALAEYYLSNGVWPQTLQALGMGGEEGYRGQWIAEVRLLADGVIALQRKPEAGGGKLELRPKVYGSQLSWECISDWADAELILPGCRRGG